MVEILSIEHSVMLIFLYKFEIEEIDKDSDLLPECMRIYGEVS